MSGPVHIFMFIDALGWEIANQYRFMEQELPYRVPVKMQFGYSSTAIPTILSGKTPQVHKHLSFYYYAPELSPFKIFKYLPFRYLPKAIFNRWRVRHMLSRIVAGVYGFTGYFELYAMPYERLPYFDYAEKKDLFAPGGLAPTTNLADVLEASGLPYIVSDWRKTEAENIEQALTALTQGKIRFAFLYTAALDGLLHMKVDDPQPVREKLDFYAAHIRRLIAAANENYSDVTFSVISDHGMTLRSGTADIKRVVESAGLEFGKDYAAAYDSTMARFWFITEKSRQTLLPVLKTIPDSHLLSSEEKQRYGIAFEDNMYGEEILLMEPGIQIEPSDMGLRSLPGMHGFAPEDKHSNAAFLSNSPPPEQPAWVGDYFNIMTSRITELKDVERA